MQRSPTLNEYEVITRWATKEEGERDEGNLTDKKYRQGDHDEIRPVKRQDCHRAYEQDSTPTRGPKAEASEGVKFT
jgi:hypothetical protein